MQPSEEIAQVRAAMENSLTDGTLNSDHWKLGGKDGCVTARLLPVSDQLRSDYLEANVWIPRPDRNSLRCSFEVGPIGQLAEDERVLRDTRRSEAANSLRDMLLQHGLPPNVKVSRDYTVVRVATSDRTAWYSDIVGFLRYLQSSLEGWILDATNLMRGAEQFSASGESEAHRELKEYIANNPQLVKLPLGADFELECRLPSGDRLDVSFNANDLWLAVEVKPRSSQESDLVRGVFQCLKYAEIMRAKLKTLQESKRVEAVLVLGGSLPPRVEQLARLLNVAVIHDVRPEVLNV